MQNERTEGEERLFKERSESSLGSSWPRLQPSQTSLPVLPITPSEASVIHVGLKPPLRRVHIGIFHHDARAAG